MINRQQRNQLSETIRHLASGTISFSEFKRRRNRIFGNDADFDDLEFNDVKINDLSAIILSCEALSLCELLRGKSLFQRLLDHEPKDGSIIRSKISAICLFLYSDQELDILDQSPAMARPCYKYDTLLFALSLFIFFGGLFGSAILTGCYFYNYASVLMPMAIVSVFTTIILISEHTRRQNSILEEKYKKECFFKYPFITKASYRSTTESKVILGAGSGKKG